MLVTWTNFEQQPRTQVTVPTSASADAACTGLTQDERSTMFHSSTCLIASLRGTQKPPQKAKTSETHTHCV